jgi:methylated-DNA-[protein]-cysteine S-methyltransferase
MASISFTTEIGEITLFCKGDCLTQLVIGTTPPAHSLEIEDTLELQTLLKAKAELIDYFSGKQHHFTLKIAQTGTAFREQVWALMRTIPFGQTLSYALAAKLLNTSPRALGGACGANPLPILTPCHRIVGSTGLGGFSGGAGLATKSWLLTHENRYAAIS